MIGTHYTPLVTEISERAVASRVPGLIDEKLKVLIRREPLTVRPGTTLRACLERKCPPDEDIAATLAHAENLFVAGDYEKARAVLRRSLGRNRKHSDRYPVPVSDLYRANALVANHLGFEEDYFHSTWGTLGALKEGMPDSDWRLFGARSGRGSLRRRTSEPSLTPSPAVHELSAPPRSAGEAASGRVLAQPSRRRVITIVRTR